MNSAKSAARAAQDSTVFRVVARIGYVVLGLLHVVIGAIAISVATGAGGGDADQGGALEQIRNAPLGVVLLWIIVVGLAALAVWQLAEAFVERDPDTKKRWAYRFKYIGTALVYLAIAGTALIYALGGRSDSSESSKTFSAELLSTPAGVVLLALVGAVVLAIGIAFVYRGVTRAFEKRLDLPSGTAGQGIVIFGVVGYVAKGIAIAVTGILFGVAAFTQDAETAGGLDAALHALAALPFGPAILWVIGAGLIIYGLFCVARAKFSRM